MKFIEATIYGFGKWIDETIDFSNQPFICIYGENESGKSTLQHFILFMLFGLPPKQRTLYQPKTSSKLGGRLTVVDDNVGTFVIERVGDVRNGAAVCYTEDGQTFDEQWLQERLHGMNAKIYKSIYAFSALDLTAIRQMKEQDIGEVLLGIGTSGASHLYAIEKKLEQQIGELFKPNGKIPAINKQLEKLEQLQFELASMKAEEGTYQKRTDEAKKLGEKLEKLRVEIQHENQQLIQLDKTIQFLPSLQELHTCVKRLAELPEDIRFPEQGVERLRQLKEKLLPIKSELAILKSNASDFKQNIQRLEATLKERLPLKEAESILQEKQFYIDNEREIQHLTDSIERLDVQMISELKKLHLPINRANLKDVHFPFQLEKTWNTLKNRQQSLELEQEQLTKEKRLLDNKESYVEAQLKELEEQLLPQEKRDELEQLINEHKEYALLQQLKQEDKNKKAAWKQTKLKKQRRSQRILIASLFLASFVGVIAFMVDTPLRYYLLNIMAIGLVGGFGQHLWGKNAIRTMEKMINSVATDEELDKQDSENRKEAEKRLTIDQDYRTEQKSALEQLQQLSVQQLQWAEKEQIYLQKKNKLMNDVDAEKNTYPFLEGVDVQYWPELFHSLKNLLQANQEQQQLMEERQKKIETHEEFTSKVDKFLQAHLQDFIPKHWLLQLEKIEEDVQAYRQVKEQKQYFEEQLQVNAKLQQDMDKKLGTYNLELESLLNHAEVEDENAFYEKAALQEEQMDRTKRKNHYHNQLTTAFSAEALQPLLKHMPNLSELELSKQTVKDTIQSLETELEDARQELAATKAKLDQMESSESYSKEMHRLQNEVDQLQSLTKEWAILKTAKELLRDTKKSYQDKHLGKVLERTARYFNVLTGGAYIRVILPEENEPLYVETRNQQRFDVNELSQGTIDQLYVSLRIAISEVMSEGKQLPFIIDDAFVHFDSIRRKRMLQLLEELSSLHQVLLFTCNKDVLKAVQHVKTIHLAADKSYGQIEARA
ncbi:AAA family ATPase [Virgibacillus sp. LDC-1]|uniref:ATP-binding protein n=1 Tax=Virgibacillus sp. LDC-1 TaxID=3039856 RepID=UPI0024DED48C|nr:AAA family ATPase [Virgibacillus sp. LDC-1]